MDVTRVDGWAGARCRTVDPELFFPVGEKGTTMRRQIAEAKEVCMRCPIANECRGYALANPQATEAGIWGGMTARERRAELRKLAGKRSQGRNTVDGRDEQIIGLIVGGHRMDAASRIDKAVAAVRLFARGDLTREEVGRRVGVAPRTVGHYVQRAQNGEPLLGATKVSA